MVLFFLEFSLLFLWFRFEALCAWIGTWEHLGCQSLRGCPFIVPLGLGRSQKLLMQKQKVEEYYC
jgi:hypothetical protein